LFIVIEGIEGSGKSTFAAALAERLRAEGSDVVVTREPGGTPLGDAVREIFLNRDVEISPLAESLLVNAARAQHVQEVIRPALAAGRVVVCDRFIDSTIAYQGYGRGAALGPLLEICEIAAEGLEPNLVLVLDVGVGTARERMRDRSLASDRIESEGDAFHERVRQGFLELAKSPRHRLLDGTLPTESLVETAMVDVRNLLQPRVP
jgi:dTMP kinase